MTVTVTVTVLADDPFSGSHPLDGGNFVFGNALGLSASKAEQITTTPGGIPIPEAPEWSPWD